MRFRPSMRAGFVTLAVLVAWSSVAAQSTVTPSQHKVVCGSDCLQEFAERFLYALTSGKPAAVPLAPAVRYTENGSVLAIGDALWATAEKLGENRLVFTDPASGGIHLYASVVGNSSRPECS